MDCRVLGVLAMMSVAVSAPGLLAQGREDGSPPTGEIAELKAQLKAQQAEIEQLKKLMADQKSLLESLAKPAAAQPAVAARPALPNLGQVASTTPMVPTPPPPPPVAIPSPAPAPQAADQSPSPLQIPIGSATITPVGFMDMTNTFRSTNSGASLATNFGNFPYNNNLPTGRLTEDKLSPQNSRIGARIDALVHDWHVMGYWESDFVGTIGTGVFNTQVSSDSFPFRIRLYWVDVRKGKFEVLGGQSWSMMTPNRKQISPLPGDLFYGQEFDVNYLNGLTWGRIPGFRFLYHPSEKVTAGVSFENASQYFGGSGGAPNPTLPAALSGILTTELDSNQANGVAIPNVHPDIIAKLAFDPNSHVHFEVAGVESTVKLFNPNTQQYFTKAGGGGAFNGNFEIAKGLRFVTNNFLSRGEGRYLFGEAADFIVRADGSPSLIQTRSTLDGFEFTHGNSTFYGYYGGIFIGKNVALDTNRSFIGYGFPGSANSNNRSIQEGTIGWNQTFWKDPKYGALGFYLQYAYFFRNPWSVAAGAPKNAHQNAAWFDLRYTLPGSAPAIKY